MKTLRLESEIVESSEVVEKKRRHYLFVVGWVAKYLTSRSQAIAEFENPLHNCNHELAVIHLDCSSERLLSASFCLPSSPDSTAPSTPPSQSPDIRVRAVIALPSLELEESYLPDDDVVKNVPGLVRRVSEQFDQAFCPEEPFDYDDVKLFPGGYITASPTFSLAYHLHRAES